MKPLCVLISALIVSVTLDSASAETRAAGGLTFSDELGGFRLISVSGTGSILDPIVIVEEITGIGPTVLVIRGRQERSAEGYIVTSPAFVSVAMIKIVVNRSGQIWAGFDLELREALPTPSSYPDGLSFDQSRSFNKPMNSDAFAAVKRVSEPYDRVNFYSGNVDPGATARFNFYITDPTAVREFYLLQEPHYLMSGRMPEGKRIAATTAPVLRRPRRRLPLRPVSGPRSPRSPASART